MSDSNAKKLAQLLDGNGDVLLDNLDNISVTPASVSDQSNTSTGAFDIPSGTTAERPGSPNAGYIRFNTDNTQTEIYNGTEWNTIGLTPAVLSSVTGTIYAGLESTLTLTGTGFLEDNLVVNFSQSSDGIDEDVTVTPASDTSASVTVPSAVYSNVTAGNVVTITVTNSDGQSSGGIDKTAGGLPTGGTITTSGNYRIHTFTSSSSLVVPSGFSADVEYLIVAGGGGGGGTSSGNGAAGGGAGGLLAGSTSVTPQTYTITIGSGGSGQSSQGVNGTSGQNSSALGLTATGGGGGAGSDNGSAGGSGGGGRGGSGSGGSGTSGQGNDGGNGSTNSGGGGGGAGSVGGNAGSNNPGGDAGDGLASSITGSSTIYACGGIGCGQSTDGSQATGGNSISENGSDNSGNGGAGKSDRNPARNGGSGVVIVRYDTTTL